jgi:hypothetical protein
MTSHPTTPIPAAPATVRPNHLRLMPPPSPSTVRARDRWLGDDDGMSTVEYAIGTIAAAAFAALLYAVISGDTVLTALTDLVQRALTATF